LIVLAIVIVTVTPAVMEFLRERRARRNARR